MDTRLDYSTNETLRRFVTHINAAGAAVGSTESIPAATHNLVLIRASQINGCSFCLDMHTKDAAAAGETALRINLVAAWREATVFTDPERAALDLTEQGTRIADAAGGVPDDVWSNAATYYDSEQLAALVCTIALINLYNRMNVMCLVHGGDYTPGQFG